MRIMIVDDSISQRMKLKFQLNAAGYTSVSESSNGLELLKEYSVQKFDIVILDLIMPEMDGKTALQEILKKDEYATVIIHSSMGCEDEIEECLTMGACSYIQKPASEEQIFSALKKAEKNQRLPQ